MKEVWATLVALWVLEHEFPNHKTNAILKRAEDFVGRFPTVAPDLARLFGLAII